MDEVVKKLFENKSASEISTMLININRMQLNRKVHIKKYNRIRKLHSEIIDSMQDYLDSGKYDINKYSKLISSDMQFGSLKTKIYLNSDDIDDRTILNELFMYKNHNDLPSITEIYLKKNKFRNEEKVKMLNCMNNSYVGLFKIIAVDGDNGYVTYEDVFTHKKFKVVDIAMSSTFKPSKDITIYFYNRIITFDDISFGTGIHCMMTSDNRELMNFIKKHNYNKCNNFSRCIQLYSISKKEKELKVGYNNQYGYRR